MAEVAGSLRVVMGGCGRGVEKGTPLARSLTQQMKFPNPNDLAVIYNSPSGAATSEKTFQSGATPWPPQQSFFSFFFASLESAVQKDKPIQAGLHFVCKHTGLI